MYLFQFIQKANEADRKLSVSNSLVTFYESCTTTSIRDYRSVVFMNEDETEWQLSLICYVSHHKGHIIKFRKEFDD